VTVEQIGRHRISNGDLFDGIAALMGGERAQLVYSDPPWGDGNLKMWYTINQRDNGVERREHTIREYLDQFFGQVAAHTTGDALIWVEYGLRWRGQLLEQAEAHGLRQVVRIDICYGSKPYPHDLHLFARQDPPPLPAGYVEAIAGTKGYRTVQRAVEPLARPDAIILDPNCGLGYTAQAAVDYGMRFCGNELNAQRLDRTRKRLLRDA
jgi:hypothetical protein